MLQRRWEQKEEMLIKKLLEIMRSISPSTSPSTSRRVTPVAIATPSDIMYLYYNYYVYIYIYIYNYIYMYIYIIIYMWLALRNQSYGSKYNLEIWLKIDSSESFWAITVLLHKKLHKCLTCLLILLASLRDLSVLC